MVHLFPIFLNLYKKNCLLIGGGQVAERKVEDLLDYGARVKLVSPQVTDRIRIWAERGIITCYDRRFQEDDLQGVFMVFTATNDSTINKKVAALCRQRDILVNTVDDPSNCDFYVPSILRRNSLTLAISTEGKSPLYARKLRQDLENIITREYGEFVDILGEQRDYIKRTVPDINMRKKIFEAIVNSDILDLLEAGEKEKVRERIRQCMSSWRE